MPFPIDFLTRLAKEKKLSDRETEVFLMLFGEGKSRVRISQDLNISESGVSTTLGKVYEKFKVGIDEAGPVKESRLKDYLTDRLRKCHSETPIVQPPGQSEVNFLVESSSNSWVEEVRSRCCKKILYQHSTIQLLNQTEIGVDQLYVDVWLLNRPLCAFQPGLKMMESFDLRNDRLGLGEQIKRNEGMAVANDSARLLILGKPGVGKTTFLKHLAVDCSNGKFQPNLIPVLIELRKIQSKGWRLLDALSEELSTDNQQTKNLLEEGRLLILMDGLDEVPTDSFRRNVQEQLRSLAQEPKHSGNRFILTCRTQIVEVIPQGFAPVEVAEFKDEQVETFVRNWFRASGQTKEVIEQQWQAFSDATKHSSALKELTVTPVLLSLMCWVFQDSGELPSQAALLYRKGIRLLLEKWNDRKEIPVWEIGGEAYRQLVPWRKEALLSEIAARKFENSVNFVLFEQKNLVEQIVDFLDLANAQKGEAVLRAIETQHGLLVERADELWSFSHLTFQEYFTAQWLNQLQQDEGLAEKIIDKRWQRIFKVAIESQQPADRLLRLIKQAIDYSVSQDAKLQEFLTWVQEKAKAVGALYKLAAIRAFYFAFALDLTLTLNLTISRARNLARADRDIDINIVYALALAHAHDLDFDHDLDLAHALNNDIDLAHARNLAYAFDHDCDLALDIDPTLANKLQQLSMQNREDSQHWWITKELAWTEELRQAMIDHRKIGHDWQFTESQEQALQRYYDANKFLVELLKQDGAVSESVRQEIEDNLLLPIAELKRRLPDQYS